MTDITILTSDTPDLRKTFGSAGQTAAGKISAGYYQTWNTDIPSLASWLSNVQSNQCLCLGSPQRESGRICTTTVYNGEIDPIPRTEQHFQFQNGPTWMTLDIDGQSPDAVDRLLSVVPELASCGYIIKPSSNPNPDKYSWHIYIQVTDGTDIPAFMKRLSKLLWVSGLGHIFISKTGGCHIRSLIDESVGSPERIIYEADPELLDGIVKPERETIVHDGGLFDTRCVKELDAGMSQVYDAMIQSEMNRVSAEAGTIRREYHKRTGIPEYVQDEILQDSDLLYFNRSTPVAMSDITNEYNERTVCDPLEPEYNNWHNTVAKVWVDDNGSVIVRSNAHGMGKIYRYDGLMLRSAGFGVGVEIPVGASVDPADKPIFNVSELEQYVLSSGVSEHSESQSKTDLINHCVSKIDISDRVSIELICQCLKTVTGMAIGVIRGAFKQVASGTPPVVVAALDEMNKQYSCIMLENSFRVMEEYIDQATMKPSRRFIKRHDFISYYANREFYVDNKMQTIGDLWLANIDRPTYHNIVFDPTLRSNSGTYNMYKGLAVEPVQGDWSLFDTHLFVVCCGSDPELYKYVRMWIARIIQEPGGRRPGVALILRGDKGTGKGALSRWISDIFGDHFLAAATSQHIVGRFNYIMADKIVCFADEAFFAGDKSTDGKLKAMITEPTQIYERKGIDSMVTRNHLNIIMASNSDYVVPATKGERRYAVLDMSDIHRKDIPYFKALQNQRVNGGVEAMVYDLMQDEIDHEYLRYPPMTEALREQVSNNLDSIEGFWSECIAREYIVRSHLNGQEVPFEDAITRNDLFDAYRRYCKDSGCKYPLAYNNFFRQTYGKKGIFNKHTVRMTTRPLDGTKRMFKPMNLEDMKNSLSEYLT